MLCRAWEKPRRRNRGDSRVVAPLARALQSTTDGRDEACRAREHHSEHRSHGKRCKQANGQRRECTDAEREHGPREAGQREEPLGPERCASVRPPCRCRPTLRTVTRSSTSASGRIRTSDFRFRRPTRLAKTDSTRQYSEARRATLNYVRTWPYGGLAARPYDRLLRSDAPEHARAREHVVSTVCPRS
jgi:hypothetical protein